MTSGDFYCNLGPRIVRSAQGRRRDFGGGMRSCCIAMVIATILCGLGAGSQAWATGLLSATHVNDAVMAETVSAMVLAQSQSQVPASTGSGASSAPGSSAPGSSAGSGSEGETSEELARRLDTLSDTVSRLEGTVEVLAQTTSRIAQDLNDLVPVRTWRLEDWIGFTAGATAGALVVDFFGGGGLATVTGAIVGGFGGRWALAQSGGLSSAAR